MFYGFLLPDYIYMLRTFGANRGWIRFSPRFHELTTRLNCRNYPELYQNETRIQAALFRAFFDDDEKVFQFLTNLSSCTIVEQSIYINECIKDAHEFAACQADNIPHLDDLDWSPAGQAKARLEWEGLTIEEQQQSIRFFTYSLSFSIASFFNFVALMVHGRKLTQLVNEAISGNNESFFLAIHIDKNILEYIPYFKERYQRALQECDQDFLEAVSKRLQSPQFRGKIRHRLLYVLFAILEGTHWLDQLKHREILDVCDRLNLDRYENRIETEKAIGDRLRDYRKFQNANKMSTP